MKYKAGDYVLHDTGIEYALGFIEKVDITSKRYFAVLVDASHQAVSYVGNIRMYEAYDLDNDNNVDLAFNVTSRHLGYAPVFIPPTYQVLVDSLDKLNWEINGGLYATHPSNSRDLPKSAEKHKCTCVLFDVMNYGCKCGGV